MVHQTVSPSRLQQAQRALNALVLRYLELLVSLVWLGFHLGVLVDCEWLHNRLFFVRESDRMESALQEMGGHPLLSKVRDRHFESPPRSQHRLLMYRVPFHQISPPPCIVAIDRGHHPVFFSPSHRSR